MTLNELAQKIDITINNEGIYQCAFTHRSYLNENRGEKIEHNERLEFLGDAVLELVVTEHLYHSYSDPEGVLTAWRSALVNGKMLSSVAAELELDQLLRLSRGESMANTKSRQYILANTFEALIGAIYLDSGYVPAQKFIQKYLIVHLTQILADGTHIDAKSKLQEETQEKRSITPSYRVLSEEGPDHNKVFTSGVYLDSELIGQGTGASKQLSEQAAAADALTKLNS